MIINVIKCALNPDKWISGNNNVTKNETQFNGKIWYKFLTTQNVAKWMKIEIKQEDVQNKLCEVLGLSVKLQWYAKSMNLNINIINSKKDEWHAKALFIIIEHNKKKKKRKQANHTK